MTEKELDKLRPIRKRIKRLELKIKKMEDETGVGGIDWDGMPRSHNGKSIVEQIAIETVELYLTLKEEKRRLDAEEKRLSNYIATVEDEEIKLIMEMWFIDNEVWEKIAEVLYCDPRTPARKMRKYLETH